MGHFGQPERSLSGSDNALGGVDVVSQPFTDTEAELIPQRLEAVPRYQWAQQERAATAQSATI